MTGIMQYNVLLIYKILYMFLGQDMSVSFDTVMNRFADNAIANAPQITGT